MKIFFVEFISDPPKKKSPIFPAEKSHFEQLKKFRKIKINYEFFNL